MNHLAFPENLWSPIGDPLRRIRLRIITSRRISGRWVHVSVKQRAEEQARELASAKRRDDSPKRWQPSEGRESPREEWMDWRRSMISYRFPGWMRFYHGKAMPLVGRELLYALPPTQKPAAPVRERRAER